MEVVLPAPLPLHQLVIQVMTLVHVIVLGLGVAARQIVLGHGPKQQHKVEVVLPAPLHQLVIQVKAIVPQI